MFSKSKLRTLLIFAVLNFGAVCGLPMSPDEIEELMNIHHRVEVVQMVKKEDTGDGDPPDEPWIPDPEV
jgi:hypothetical protein